MVDIVDSEVVRHIDKNGTPIKTFKDSKGRQIQAVVVVDADGGKAGVEGSPSYVKLDIDTHISELRQIKKCLEIMCLHMQAISGLELDKSDIDP